MIQIHLPFLSLQKALETRLSADMSPIKVFNVIPDSQAFPYITIGEFNLVQTEQKGFSLFILTGVVNVLSNYEGAAEAQTIASSVTASVTSSNFDLSADTFKIHWTKFTSASLATRWSEVLSSHLSVLSLSFDWLIS